MDENDIARVIVDSAYQIHRRVGPGLLESAYEAVLAYELRQRGLTVDQQVVIALTYESLHVPDAYRADLVVGGKVLIEVKSVETLAPVHARQVLTYLRLTGLKLGLLINFGGFLIKDGIQRVVNELPD